MSFRPDSPVELPNGRLVCGSHHLVVCPICIVDYSFMEEVLEEDQDSRDENISDKETPFDEESTFDKKTAFDNMTRLRVGTGRVIPTKFHPDNTRDTPQSLFPSGVSYNSSPAVCRFIHRNNAKQLLIYTDGACLDNGGANPRAGCSFVFKSSTIQPEYHSYVRFPLENSGPIGEAHPQTSNRAELRAVIAALRFRFWTGEGFDSLVIATDPEYVVEGVTSWVRGWLSRDWKTKIGAAVKNRDIWECLLGEIERWDSNGMQVKFWRIPRNWNTDADYHARHAASEDTRGGFEDLKGINLSSHMVIY
ncbi:ribonuclease H-like domain-containing protein [Aspergillus pseudonomiae]|uniref:ribonuclease H n=1 Tax=Aspergillus pseudonomiae TaxID=1506151 RepID=A0A5N6HR22_9EURO|nr:ribonuclease H-like domain-containing protein [Aspergillus pseudonomiae]KAB8256294.1 ribonuclease H-like domain-containing protein [Aspergillus pseudonomiae]KAE8405526.1 ribonuclease H-like domain-containing protein [Aspergillus pseudonomiae]